jgi:hypothetical protein
MWRCMLIRLKRSNQAVDQPVWTTLNLAMKEKTDRVLGAPGLG